MGRTIFGQVFVRGGMIKFSKWKVPPTGGAHIDVRWQDKNELASRPPPACCTPAPVASSCIAITVHGAAAPFTTVQKKCIS
jgi:hypothetical protein